MTTIIFFAQSKKELKESIRSYFIQNRYHYIKKKYPIEYSLNTYSQKIDWYYNWQEKKQDYLNGML